jgi:hypothetical protein
MDSTHWRAGQLVIDVRPSGRLGDDNVNLNDEWLRFMNARDADLDPDPWSDADESSTHRYSFAGLVLSPGRHHHAVRRLRRRHGHGALPVQHRLGSLEQRR